ncbi:hypothetical protein J1N35_022504 [Gossypium stocksii]|uniref:Uncharacterized protein n=1 Tax=Gossypium stocksii TaxID=47602 RepID=A0A9D3VGV7_9ROSI|nr:hypothetical protein J1N35_022504 [Gossypium stocksii]
MFEELFVGQQFDNKADYVFAIKQYNMKLSIDYKRTQQWQIRKLEGRHICTIACMSQDHRKLDAKSICNYIMPLAKDSPNILVPTLIADRKTRFQYRVSYRKAWWAKQMAMQQLYGDWDESYNELQGWISAIVEYISRIIVTQMDNWNWREEFSVDCS